MADDQDWVDIPAKKGAGTVADDEWEDVKPAKPAQSSTSKPALSWWKSAFAPREVPHSANVGPDAKDHPMPGSFEGHPENIGEYAPESIGNVIGGAGDVLHGDVAHGVHRIISGVGNAALPALPFLAAGAPIGTVITAGTGAAGQYGARKGAEALGASPDQADVAGDIGGLAGGLFGSKVPSFTAAARRGISKRMYTPEGELTPAAHAIAHPTEIPEAIGRKIFPEPAEQVAQRKAGQQFEELTKRQQEIETARQKELSDKARMVREETKQHEKFAGTMEKTEAARQKELAANERLKAMHGNDLMRRGAEQEALDAKAAKEAAETESVGAKIYPEPRNPLPGDRPGAMWTIPRAELPAAAQRGAPGAGDVMRNLNEPILYVPRQGVGYGPLREFEDVPAKESASTQESIGAQIGQAAPEAPGLKRGLMTERRSSVRDIQGPDLMRTARAQQLREQLLDSSLSARDRAIIQAQLDDLKANPFERHEGGDINSMKAKKTLSREEAEANTAKRKEGRNKRFSGANQ